MNVAVVGAGKMGLPVACQFARYGAHVVACDVNAAVVDAINAGSSPIDEPGIPELLGELVRAGTLTATTDTTAAVRNSDVVVVLVPVLLTAEHDADTATIETVTDRREIARYGVRVTPALVVDQRVVVSGRVPTSAELQAMLAVAPAS